MASGVVFLGLTLVVAAWSRRIRDQFAPQDDLVDAGSAADPSSAVDLRFELGEVAADLADVERAAGSDSFGSRASRNSKHAWMNASGRAVAAAEALVIGAATA